jgi:hypothetical protein
MNIRDRHLVFGASKIDKDKAPQNLSIYEKTMKEEID